MSVKQWALGAKHLKVATPEGLPSEVRMALRRLESFGILDDAFFLRVIADTISVDPIGLCATIQGGHLSDVPGLDTRELRFIGTAMCMSVYDGDRFAGEVVVGLTSNNIDLVQHRINVDNADNVDIVQVSAAPLRSEDLFQLINHAEPKERLSRLRKIFEAFSYSVQTAENTVDMRSIAQMAVDSIT